MNNTKREKNRWCFFYVFITKHRFPPTQSEASGAKRNDKSTIIHCISDTTASKIKQKGKACGPRGYATLTLRVYIGFKFELRFVSWFHCQVDGSLWERCAGPFLPEINVATRGDARLVGLVKAGMSYVRSASDIRSTRGYVTHLRAKCNKTYIHERCRVTR